MLMHARDGTAADPTLRPAQLRLPLVPLAGDVGLPVGPARLFERQIWGAVRSRRRCNVGTALPRVAFCRDVGGTFLCGPPIDPRGDAGVAVLEPLHSHYAWLDRVDRQQEAIPGLRLDPSSDPIGKGQLVPVAQRGLDLNAVVHGATIAEFRLIRNSRKSSV